MGSKFFVRGSEQEMQSLFNITSSIVYKFINFSENVVLIIC